MKTQYSTILAFLAILLLSACAADTQGYPEPVHFENSTLDVLVQLETDTGNIPAPAALIYLYKNEQDRADNYGEEVKAETNAAGEYQFVGLSKHEYWITVALPGDGRVKHIYENDPFATPGHPVVSSSLNVVFRK